MMCDPHCAIQITWSGKRFSGVMIGTMVALWSDQRARLRLRLIVGRTKISTMFAPRSDQRSMSGHKLPQKITTEHYPS